MSRTHSPAGPQRDTAHLRATVEDSRAELGRTLQALAAKTDLKGQMREKAVAATYQAREQAAVATHRVGRTASRTFRREGWLVAVTAGCIVWLVARQARGTRGRRSR
ncbi:MULTISPECIES: hypothetical protein [unclassified Streptomyces]|uniref:hypothetical protein n=1 Tax=Streptomyces sp. NPDC023588 TaxID=3154907 RepID=UPI0033F7457F